MEKTTASGAVCQAVVACRQAGLHRRLAARPASARPNSVIVAGSGTSLSSGILVAARILMNQGVASALFQEE
jgi:hypothetical protein